MTFPTHTHTTSLSPSENTYTILSSADSKYYSLIFRLAKNIQQFSQYQFVLYDLGLTDSQRISLERLGVHLEKIPFDPSAFAHNSRNNIRTVHKVDCIVHFLETYKKSVLFMDADMLFIEDAAKELWPDDNQIVLTRRCDRENKPRILLNGKINAGIMGFGRNVDPGFFAAWRQLCADPEHTDQSAMSALVEPWVDWNCLDVPQKGNGCSVVLRDGNLYNDISCRIGKIFHFKGAGGRRPVYRGFVFMSILLRLLPSLTRHVVRFNRKHRLFVWKAKS